MMKKSCLWMPAAILACGLAASSCSKDDDPVTSADPAASAQQQTQYEEMPAQPTADQLTTKITRPTFVFAGDYTGEGKALVARAANAVGIDRAEVVIMPGAQVARLTEEQLHSMVAVLANEGTDSKLTINVEADKEGAEGEYDILPVEVEYGNDFSDYYFGKKADDFVYEAKW